MQNLPARFPAQDDPDTVLPTVWAIFPDSSWPPSSGDLPVGVAALTKWSTARDLTGGLLPSQVRGATGLSIGRGSIEFPQPEADTLAPWRADTVSVPTGRLLVHLVAGDQGPFDDVLDLGHFIAQVRSGSLTGPTVTLDLIEEVGAHKTRVRIPKARTELGGPIDPAYVIDTAARALGMYSTPPPVASAVASVPLTGAAVSETGDGVSSIIVGDWTNLDGQVVAKDANVTVTPPAGTDELYVTLTATEKTDIKVRVLTGAAFDVTVTIDPVAGTVKAGSGTTKNFTPGLDPNHPMRVTVKIRLRKVGGSVYVYASAKSTHDADLSGESYESVSGAAIDPPVVLIHTDGIASGVQVTTGDDPGLWAHPTARISASGTTLDALLLDGRQDAWQTVQAVTAATLGLCWTDETGVLVYRPHGWLKAQPTSETLQVASRLTDLPWSLDPDDRADRVEVTYTPPSTRTVSDHSLNVWEAAEVIEVPAGETVDVLADFDGFADDLATWSTPGGQTVPDTGSQYFASTAKEGGSQVTSGVTVSNVVSRSSRITVRIKNTRGSSVWMVDHDGAPMMKLRANIVVKPGDQQSVTTGASEDDAAAPLTVDLGQWCQNLDRARSIRDEIAAQASTPRWQVAQVEAVPHAGRQIGDIVRLTDEATDLNVKMAITGISLTGPEMTQKLTLAVIEDE